MATALRSAVVLFATLLPIPVYAESTPGGAQLDLTGHWVGYACLAIFFSAYLLVTLEEKLQLRKSKSVTLAAGIIWVLIGIAYAQAGDKTTAAAAVRHNLLEFGELFLFLLSAMTFINTMEERQVFDALRVWLVGRGLSLRSLFWVTGLLAFCISPIADNLTTTLVMGAVAVSVGGGDARFIVPACVNIVVAANAGGAFSPFGDITTLMVWQAGVLQFLDFFALVVPSIVTWVVPAAIMSLGIPKTLPDVSHHEIHMRPGALVVVTLFLSTIVFTVILHNSLHLPPVLGMMTGLGALKLYSYVLKRKADQALEDHSPLSAFAYGDHSKDSFDIFRLLERVEWDTLMFFYGVILCVGGLGTLGYLALAGGALYTGLGPTGANVIIGLLSAVVDNIPVMFAVLSMRPEMSQNQWLLVTLTAGVGGSLLSVGSAAGVALMGQARGVYTFMSHLKWSWAVALGYAAGIGAHLALNGR